MNPYKIKQSYAKPYTDAANWSLTVSLDNVQNQDKNCLTQFLDSTLNDRFLDPTFVCPAKEAPVIWDRNVQLMFFTENFASSLWGINRECHLFLYSTNTELLGTGGVVVNKTQKKQSSWNTLVDTSKNYRKKLRLGHNF